MAAVAGGASVVLTLREEPIEGGAEVPAITDLIRGQCDVGAERGREVRFAVTGLGLIEEFIEGVEDVGEVIHDAATFVVEFEAESGVTPEFEHGVGAVEVR